MDEIKRNIMFSGIRFSRVALRIVRAHVEKWIKKELSELDIKEPISYTAYIEREDTKYCTCYIEIKIGPYEWTAIQDGRSVHESTLKTLKNLKRSSENIIFSRKEKIEKSETSPFRKYNHPLSKPMSA